MLLCLVVWIVRVVSVSVRGVFVVVQCCGILNQVSLFVFGLVVWCILDMFVSLLLCLVMYSYVGYRLLFRKLFLFMILGQVGLCRCVWVYILWCSGSSCVWSLFDSFVMGCRMKFSCFVVCIQGVMFFKLVGYSIGLRVFMLICRFCCCKKWMVVDCVVQVLVFSGCLMFLVMVFQSLLLIFCLCYCG